MKRILALLLAVLMVLSCLALVGCSEEEKKPDKKKDKDKQEEKKDDEEKEQPDPEEFKLELSEEPLKVEKTDYNYTFKMDVPRPWGTERFVREKANGDPINDSVYNMNLAVKDHLGVTIETQMEMFTHNQSEKFIDSVLNGDHKFDVMAMHSSSTCAALVLANAVLPFDNLEACDLSKPWWNQNFSNQAKVLDNNLFAISSSCYCVYMNANIILFNKTLAKERGFEDLYELVRQKKWTVDKLITLTKNFSEDLNSDGIYDENDQLAIISDNTAHMSAWLGAFRQSTVIKGNDDEPEIVVNSSRMSTIIEKLNTLYNTGRRGAIYPIRLRETDNPSDDVYNNAFAEGRVLFDVCYVAAATKMRDYDIDFGILPMPILNEEQENYGSYVDSWCLTYAVPIDNENPERTADILETMAYYSYHLTYPAIIQQAIIGTGTRDLESVEMLTKYIFPNLYFDFGFIYDGYGKGYTGIIGALIPENSTDMASYISTKKNIAEDHFRDLYDKIQENYG